MNPFDSVQGNDAAEFVEHEDFDDDYILIDPYAGNPPNRRKDREITRILDLLDTLETERRGRLK